MLPVTGPSVLDLQVCKVVKINHCQIALISKLLKQFVHDKLQEEGIFSRMGGGGSPF